MSIELDLTRHGDAVSYINEKKYSINEGLSVVGSLVNYLRTGVVPVTKNMDVKYMDGNEQKTVEVETIDLKSKSFGDAISVAELRDLMPIAVQYIIRDEIEANIPFTSLFDEIPYTGEELNLAITDLPPIEIHEIVGGEYRKITIDHGSTTSERINVNIKAYGGIMAIEKDFLKSSYSSTYLGVIFSKLGKAFARKKEAIVQQVITNSDAVLLYDNVTPANSRMGSTSGRGIDGSYNDTLAPFDLMNAYIYGYTNFGVYYDTLIMHPFAWTAFIMTPQLKSMLIGDNGSVQYPPFPTGNNAMGFPNGRGQYNKLFPNQNIYGLPNINDPEFKLDPTNLTKLGPNPYGVYPSAMWGEWTVSPSKSGFFNKPLRIIVTPTMPFTNNSGSYTTDLILADSNNVGAIFQSQRPQVREKGRTDSFEDVVLYKFDEKYGVMPYLRGEGFGIIKNISLDREYVFENMNSVTLSSTAGRGEFTL